MVNVSSKGHVCVICKGSFEFPSEEARGLYPLLRLFPDVFICWECVHSLFKVFCGQISGKSYYFLFAKKEERVKKG